MEQTTETLSMGWLSAAIWVPIISGIIVLALGNEQRATLSRWLALLGSLVGFAVTIPLHGCAAVRRAQALDREPGHRVFARHRRPLGMAGAADGLHHLRGGHRRLGSHQGPRPSVPGGVPDPLRPDDRGVRGCRRHAVLRVLRGDADPDVHHHRGVGRPEPRVCSLQVLPLYLAGIAAHDGGDHLPVPAVGQLRDPGLAPAAAHAA